VGRLRDLHVPVDQHRLLHRRLIPDIAAVRDGSVGWRRRIYAMLALGWEGSDSQWRHYRRAYGLLAALATPLVLSVHSVVSWDFAMALVPGWHSTLFAPFFVDGAIFSGFAMVLVLVLPMRYFFNLNAYVTARHLDMMAKLILVTGLVLTYFYACELFTSWLQRRAHREGLAVLEADEHVRVGALHDVLLQLRGAADPFWKKARTSPVILYVVSVLVLIGMWFERFTSSFPRWGTTSIRTPGASTCPR